MQNRNWRFGLALALILALLPHLPALGQASTNAITIKISSVPSDSPGESMASDPIKGVVSGVANNKYKVIIYARGGDVWWVQPTVASPYTDIDANGKWESDTHGGTDFAALLVKPAFKPDAKVDAIPKVGGDVIAVTKWKSQAKTEK